MKKENMTGFKFFKAILGLIYKIYYNPKVVGKENIKKDGPILLAGNHIHIMDQCNVIISTKRAIHYMAKKEYFDSKKTKWFFQIAGCIPVDRSIKDEDAKESAIEVLKNGYALGIFPEGTRNALKKERVEEIYKEYEIKEPFKKYYKKVKKSKTSEVNYLEELMKANKITKEDFLNHIMDADSYLRELVKENKITEDEYEDHLLLPLKFGTVSMAEKTNAYIIPYGITGTYRFRSKDLRIRIGEPFQVGEDLEKANQKLKQEIIKLMKENEK